MEKLSVLNQEVIETIAKSNPGDFAIYQLKEKKLIKLYLSDDLATHSGMTEEEYENIMADDAMEIVLEADKGKVYAIIDTLVKEKKDADFTYRISHKTSGIIWVHAKARIIGMFENAPVLMVIYCATTTEASAQTMLLDDMEASVYVVDQNTFELLFANQTALNLWNNGFFQAETCYQFVNGRTEICPWCSIPLMKDGYYHTDAVYSPQQDKWFEIDCREMLWHKRAAIAVTARDITQQQKIRKNLEEDKEKLQKSRQIYEAAVQEAKLVTWEYDIRNHRIIMSDNEFTQYDYRKFNLPKVIENAPQSLRSFIEDSCIESFMEMYRKVENGAKRASCEVWYKLVDGHEPRCERISYTTLFDENGKPVRAYGIGQNITARRLEEENYVRLYRQISESLSDSLSSAQLNLSQNKYIKGYGIRGGIYTELEREAADEYFMAAIDKIYGENYRQEALRIFSCKKLMELFQKGETRVTAEYPVDDMTGKLSWVGVTIHLLQNPQNGDIEAITYAKDITNLKRDEEIISRFTQDGCDFIGIIDCGQKVFEIHDGNWKHDSFRKAQQVDYEKCCSMLVNGFLEKKDRDEFLGKVTLEKICKELGKDAKYTVIYDYINQKKQEKRQKKQISFHWLNESMQEILVIQTDITEASQNEQQRIEQLQAALLETEKANSAKTEFISRISHDIRTPISIIKSMTDFAFEDIGKEQKLRNDLRKIQASNEFLLSLINDVLDISKVDSGKVTLHPEPYLLADYISNICNMFEPLCQQKHITFEVEEHCAVKAIIVDQTRLNQVTLNLLSNAVKYTPENGKITFLAESRELEKGVVACTVTIADTGIGMSEQFQKIMFEPFTQEYENPGRDRTMMGTGLGLSIVKKLMDLINGRITVQSKLGEGTRISLHIVARQADAVNKEKATIGELQKQPEKLSGSVLLAEDNIVNTEIALRMLTSFGLNVVHAENGKKAVELFKHSDPGTFEAILMDIQMPIMNGYEATKAIRGMDRADAGNIPIIAMTADAFSAALEHSREVGMNDYVTKPIDARHLQEVLQKHWKINGKGQ